MKTVRRLLVTAGALTIAYAVAGALRDPDVDAGVLVFLAAVLAFHDGLLLPVTIAVGALAGRYVPLRARAAVQAALLISLAVTVVAFPLVLGRGRVADNPSVLPRDYLVGLLTVYAVVWTAAIVRLRWGRHKVRSPGTDGPRFFKES